MLGDRPLHDRHRRTGRRRPVPRAAVAPSRTGNPPDPSLRTGHARRRTPRHAATGGGGRMETMALRRRRPTGSSSPTNPTVGSRADELLAQVARGDEAAFAELYDLVSP